MQALLHHNTDFIPYEAVSSVMIHTPLAGFSSITFYAYGREIRVHGFLQREVREMKWLVEGMLKRQHICLAVLNKSVNFFRKRQVTE